MVARGEQQVCTRPTLRHLISVAVLLAVAVAPKLPKRTIEEIGVLVDLLIPSLIIVGSRNVHHAGSVQAWFKFLCL